MRDGSLSGAVARLVIACLVLTALGAGGFDENEVKAAFLFNFPRFVEWPENVLGPVEAPFTICLVGDNAIEEPLVRIVEGERVLGHPFLVRRVELTRPITGCQEVFVSDAAVQRLPAVLAAAGGQPVLTVGESESFLRAGGMILMRRDGNRIALDVSLAAAQKSKLQLSSKLLRIARITDPEPAP